MSLRTVAQVDDEGMVIRDSVDVQFSPVLKHDLVGDGQARRLGESDDEGTIAVVCSVTFLSSDDVHEGRCAMPSSAKIPLAGSFRLSVSLLSGELVGGSEYGIDVTACPPEWFFHAPSGSCKACDTSKSVCNGGKELPIPKQGFWSDFDNAELGFVCATTSIYIAPVWWLLKSLVTDNNPRDNNICLSSGTHATTRRTAGVVSFFTIMRALKARPQLTRAPSTFALPRRWGRCAANASGHSSRART